MILKSSTTIDDFRGVNLSVSHRKYRESMNRSHPRIVTTIIAALASAGLGGCFPLPNPSVDDNTKMPPANQLVGTWKIAPESVQQLDSLGISKAQTAMITLRSDKSFTMLQVPAILYTGSVPSRPQLHTLTGSWRLEGTDGDCRLTFTSRDAIFLTADVGRDTRPHLMRFMIGDTTQPDDVVVFEQS
jgi:hypothetical protein